MIALVVGVLVVSALLTFVFARRAATDATRDDLVRKAPQVRDELAQVQTRVADAPGRTSGLRAVVTSALLIEEAHVVVLRDDGTVESGAGVFSGREAQLSPPQRAVLELPPGLPASRLDADALRAGDRQVDRVGRTIFVAEPMPAAATGDGLPVLVMTKTIDTRPVTGLALTYGLVAAGATAVAALVAVLLARRLTRPIGELRRTAHALAGGDLSARAEVPAGEAELAELARALNGLAGELETARGAERAFLMSVSHDLRTPLTSIRGYAEAIADGTIGEAGARERAATVIRAEATRLERLVQDLLDLARLDAHEFALTPVPVDAGDVVRTAVDAFRPAAAEAGVTLSVAAGTITADADPVRLNQIVGNLTENALKYATSLVQVSAGASGGDLVITVDDDGPGIAPEDLPRVFERLYAARAATGRALGTGLGLAIVRELATAMGGRVHAEVLPTGGTRSWVVLPVVRMPAST